MDLLSELKALPSFSIGDHGELIWHYDDDPAKGDFIDRDDMIELIDKYGWHDVSEKPEANKPVLVSLEKAVIRAIYVPPFTNTEDSYDGDDVVYNEEKDEYYWPEGWYECNLYDETHYRVDEPVLAWMPLPEPYKKEE